MVTPIFAAADELPDKPQPRPEIQHMIEYPVKSIANTVKDAVTFRDKQASGLAAIEAGFLVSDGVTTETAIKQGNQEIDPVAKLFIGTHPTWGSMAPWGTVQVFGTYWLSARMHRSQTWVRHIWWLPEVVGIASNVYGTANNIQVVHRH